MFDNKPCSSFLDDIDRITQPRYIPTDGTLIVTIGKRFLTTIPQMIFLKPA